jgi:enamine deaminase RidA (YjgF/YER057c/UK114 family)
LRVDDYPVFRQIRREYLAEPYPASSVTCAPQFAFPGMLIEIEAVASLPTRTP